MIKGIQQHLIEIEYNVRGREIALDPGFSFAADAPSRMEILRENVIRKWLVHPSDCCVACIRGDIRFALFDARRDSATFGEINELFFGEHQPQWLVIPAGVYFGYQNVGSGEAWLLCAKKGKSGEVPPPDCNFIPFEW